MAEAVAAFSVAASIIQFIDFGSKLTNRIWHFYKASRKNEEALPDVQRITADLLDVVKGVDIPDNEHNEVDSGLQQLVVECHNVATDLLKLLNSLHADNQSKREAMKAAFRLMWREEEILLFHKRLDQCRTQLMIHFLASLRRQSGKSVHEQKIVLEKVESVLQVTQRLEGSVQQALQSSQGLGTLMLDLLISKLSTTDQAEERRQLRKKLIGAILRADLQSENVAEHKPEISSLRHQELTKRTVAQLHFPYMEDREEQIAQAHANTFRWIFDEDSQQEQKWSNFKQWLESNAQLYWMTGKAGSGKSTLMKYICQPTKQTSIHDHSANLQPRCVRHLKEWAAGKKLRIAKFFLWNSGASLQMTQAGLVRSLLHQILVWAPELVPHISPKRWEVLCLFNEDSSDRWSDHELEQMMRSAIIYLPDETKLCLFIDDLDEFDGNHDVLIRLLKDTLATNRNIKLCVSTRPWDIFADAFHQSASLRLQDLTFEDMKSYTSSELHADPRFALLQERESEYAQNLVGNIVSKASGVFLWVRLVVSSLLAGIGHGDRIVDLQKRLDLLPPELEQLYDKMLDSVDAFYLEHSAQILSMTEESQEPPSVLLMSFMDEENLELSLKRPIGPMLRKEAALRVDTMRRRLNACTKGLLEVPSATIYLEQEFNFYQANNWTVQ